LIRDSREYLLVKTELSNVGMARVKLAKGCTTTVFAHALPRKMEYVLEPDWEELSAFELFEGQQWVEPNGLLADQQLIALPGLSGRFLKVWAHVVSKNVAWNSEQCLPRCQSRRSVCLYNTFRGEL